MQQETLEISSPEPGLTNGLRFFNSSESLYLLKRCKLLEELRIHKLLVNHNPGWHVDNNEPVVEMVIIQ